MEKQHLRVSESYKTSVERLVQRVEEGIRVKAGLWSTGNICDSQGSLGILDHLWGFQSRAVWTFVGRALLPGARCHTLRASSGTDRS